MLISPSGRSNSTESLPLVLASQQVKPLAPAPAAPDPLAHCFAGSDRSRAWCLFQGVVDSAGPVWGNWTPIPADGMDSTTSDMCATPNATSQPPQNQPIPTSGDMQKQALLSSLRLPVQLTTLQTGPNAKSPQFSDAAAVLYNDALRQSICDRRNGRLLHKNIIFTGS